MNSQTMCRQIPRPNPSTANVSFDEIEQAHGYLDGSLFSPDQVVVGGWMLHPDQEITSLRIYLNGALGDPVALEARPDVGGAFPGIPHAAQSGFRVHLDPAKLGSMQQGRVDVVGYRADEAIIRLSTLYRTDLDSYVPTPPQELMYRVAGTRASSFFKVWGLKCYADFIDILRRHSPFDHSHRQLDWGCGCGRLTAHFLKDRSGPEVFGCDVDSEAIAWCNANLLAERFTTIDPFPPMPYANASFHLATGYSIFTHLTKEMQFAWLAEIRRILAPGGIFVATVHGDSASAAAFPGKTASVLETGIYDGFHDDVLDGIVPKGYYRGTFQTQEYTLREWSKYFDILEYKVRGIGNHQDVVVMRRPA